MDTSHHQTTAPLVLGIEAGATHTVAIADGGDEAPFRREFGPANLQLLDDRRLERHLRAIAKAMPSPAAVAIGMSGARTDADRARVRRAAERVWRGVPCHATSDLETALMAAPAPPAKRSPGLDSAAKRKSSPGLVFAGRRRQRGGTAAPEPARVLVISGTGSCCLGRRADGSTERLGGWGHILGDRGSGYDIAVRALRAVIQHADRTRQWPPLGQRFMTTLLINEPHDLVTWIQAASKPDTANLARIVFDAAAARDPIARRVITETAEILATDAVACAALVAATGTPVHFVLGGSVLVKQPGLVAMIRRRIAALWPRATVTVQTAEGACGAVAIARKLLGTAMGISVGTGVRRREPQGLRNMARLPSPALDTNVPSLAALTASPTEQRNPRSMALDTLSIDDAVALMLDEDRRVPRALFAQRAAIAKGVSLIVRAFTRGGRLFYVGAGTSGRLGVLDASECPPTFNTPPEMVQGIIAGGTTALWTAIEGAEDDREAGARAIVARGVGNADVVVGIAASGRTPFVWGALGAAASRGAATILLCFNPHVAVPRGQRPTLVIAPNVGPELLTGSTRLKSGTATKLVLNVFTTIAMVRIGKVKSNLMVDVRATNVKLRDRAVRITMALAGADAAAARAALEQAGWRILQACARLNASTRPRRP